MNIFEDHDNYVDVTSRTFQRIVCGGVCTGRVLCCVWYCVCVVLRVVCCLICECIVCRSDIFII